MLKRTTYKTEYFLLCQIRTIPRQNSKSSIGKWYCHCSIFQSLTVKHFARKRIGGSLFGTVILESDPVALRNSFWYYSPNCEQFTKYAQKYGFNAQNENGNYSQKKVKRTFVKTTRTTLHFSFEFNRTFLVGRCGTILESFREKLKKCPRISYSKERHSLLLYFFTLGAYERHSFKVFFSWSSFSSRGQDTKVRK